ncbi:MAG: ABC transporter permease [Nitrososphaerota archaeon]
MNLKRIFADFTVFRREYLRNKEGFFFALVFPVILILLFGAIFSGSGHNSITVYALNEDRGPLGTSFLQTLNQTGAIRVVSVPSNASFPDYLLKHSYSQGILIPSSFSNSIYSRNEANIILYSNPADSSTQIVSGVVNTVAEGFNLRLSNSSSLISISQKSVNESSPSYIDFLIPGLIGFTVLTSPMFSMVNLSAEYKKSKFFKQLSLTPLTKGEWLTSKILWYVILSLVAFILMTATGTFLFGARVQITPWVFPFIILGSLLFVSLGMLVGTITKSIESAGVIGNIITFPMMFLSGTFFPLSIMPDWLAKLAHIFPLYYIIEGLTSTMVYDNLKSTIFDLAIVAFLCIIISVAAVGAFKWREE